MSTEEFILNVSGMRVEVVRKAIKNLHLAVYPPKGRVRVAAPEVMSNDAVRLAVIDKLGWIKRQQASFAKQPRQSEREMVTGETHFLLGRRYRLRKIAREGRIQIEQTGISTIRLYAPNTATAEQREAALSRWYRSKLKEEAKGLFAKWQQIIGVEASNWGIRRMKTKWGSCNTQSKRIWLNLELAKKPLECIEYIVVHELAHLIERHHNDRFIAVMDKHLPQWRSLRKLLNSAPLKHEDWEY